MRSLLFCFASLLIACGAPPTDAADDAGADLPSAEEIEADVALDCGGTRPASLDACLAGDGWADCAGSGEARLGCMGSDCRWFVRGCVPTGYSVSPCPVDDICCVEEGWPFREPFDWSQLTAMQRIQAPWGDGESVAVDVVIDPDLEPGPDGVVLECTCDAECADAGPVCWPEGSAGFREWAAGWDAGDDTPTLSLQRWNGYVGSLVLVEVFSDGEGYRGRGVLWTISDAIPGCVLPEPASMTRPPVALEGTLTIDGSPGASGRGELHLVFDDGVVVDATF